MKERDFFTMTNRTEPMNNKTKRSSTIKTIQCNQPEERKKKSNFNTIGTFVDTSPCISFTIRSTVYNDMHVTTHNDN